MQRLFPQFSAVYGGQLSPANKPPYATKPWSAPCLVALMEVLCMLIAFLTFHVKYGVIVPTFLLHIQS